MTMRGKQWPLVSMTGGLLFLLCVYLTAHTPRPYKAAVQDRVVIAAPFELLLTGGDRFLAANMEAMRSAATGPAEDRDDTLYRIRTHRVASLLNPCHEDNLYLGNAMLSWGGAINEGNDILRRSVACRVWDEYPPFFYGFNLHFFQKDDAEASRMFAIAAQRAKENRLVIEKTAIMIAAGQFNDEKLALDYIKHERDQSSDPKLRESLTKRIVRLEGLMLLRDAQKQYEKKSGKPLTSPQQLLDSGILSQFPVDPLGLGYQLEDGIITLRNLKVGGIN